MSNLPPSDSPGESAEMSGVYADIRAALGTDPPNFFTAMAPRADLAASVWGMMKLLFAQGSLPPSLTQMIAVAISEEAGCRYCAVIHRNALEEMGIDGGVIARYLEGSESSELPELHARILSFATQAARDPNSVTDEQFAELRELGLGEGELLEIGILIAFTKLINTWADAARIPLDPPPAARA